MVCVNTYSLAGEYALDMHHIFSQHAVTYRITNCHDTSLTITLGEREREIEDRNRQCNHGVCM
jgi:hypothetical protein